MHLKVMKIFPYDVFLISTKEKNYLVLLMLAKNFHF